MVSFEFTILLFVFSLTRVLCSSFSPFLPSFELIEHFIIPFLTPLWLINHYFLFYFSGECRVQSPTTSRQVILVTLSLRTLQQHASSSPLSIFASLVSYDSFCQMFQTPCCVVIIVFQQLYFKDISIIFKSFCDYSPTYHFRCPSLLRTGPYFHLVLVLSA